MTNNASKYEKSLNVPQENKSRLDDSIDSKSNASDFFVSNEYILFPNNKTDEQRHYPSNTIHNNTRILLSTHESDYDASQPSKFAEIEDLNESTDTSEWHEATMLITLINKISLSPQIVVSDIEQAEWALSSLMTKIDKLYTKEITISDKIISDLKQNRVD